MVQSTLFQTLELRIFAVQKNPSHSTRCSILVSCLLPSKVHRSTPAAGPELLAVPRTKLLQQHQKQRPCQLSFLQLSLPSCPFLIFLTWTQQAASFPEERCLETGIHTNKQSEQASAFADFLPLNSWTVSLSLLLALLSQHPTSSLE